MTKKEQLEEVINKMIKPPYNDELIKLMKPCLGVKTMQGTANMGESKFGGIPDLPNGETWPKSSFDGKYFSFIGQLSFEDLSEFEMLLPKKGRLYFFINPLSLDEYKIIFSTSDNLQKAEVPKELLPKKQSFFKKLLSTPKRRLYEECRLSFIKSLSVPQPSSLYVEKAVQSLGVPVEFIEREEEELLDKQESKTAQHQILGYGMGIKNNDFELSCILEEINDNSSEEEEINAEYLEKALKWKLLFQVDSDEQTKFNFVDDGRLFFMIHEDDLEKGNFENIKMEAQFY